MVRDIYCMCVLSTGTSLMSTEFQGNFKISYIDVTETTENVAFAFYMSLVRFCSNLSDMCCIYGSRSDTQPHFASTIPSQRMVSSYEDEKEFLVFMSSTYGEVIRTKWPFMHLFIATGTPMFAYCYNSLYSKQSIPEEVRAID